MIEMKALEKAKSLMVETMEKHPSISRGELGKILIEDYKKTSPRLHSEIEVMDSCIEELLTNYYDYKRGQ